MSKSLLPYGILPSQGNLTNPGIEPRSPTLQVDSLLAEPQGKPRILQARILKCPDPSSKATLWVKAQHEGALPPPCIVRKDPRVPHTARRGA